jgi:FtsP/CotA-like multicopper oxidase with cupredoxin domain
MSRITKKTETSIPSGRAKFPLKKVLLVILAVPAAVVVTVITSAFIFIPLQKPVFVNADLDLGNRLRIPELLEPRIENGEKVFDLTVQQGTTELLPGKQTRTFGYNGTYLGPTIRAHTGDKVRMNVTNKLDDATTAHWHGMHLPAIMDGAAHQILKPRENWQPYWTITNEAAPLWYHPHLMGKTGEQVYRGLGGMFIIDDDNADSLDLPKT